jgi:hypothetical protein
VHVNENAERFVKGKIERGKDFKRIDYATRVLWEAYKFNNNTHQRGNLELYTKLRLGYKLEVPLIRPDPNANETKFQKIRLKSDKFHLAHKVKMGSDIFVIFDVDRKYEVNNTIWFENVIQKFTSNANRA